MQPQSRMLSGTLSNVCFKRSIENLELTKSGNLFIFWSLWFPNVGSCGLFMALRLYVG